MNLGQRIYRYRTAKNMSQGDLADALDVSRQSVSKWENNTAVPELDKLLKLADIFGVSLDELAGRSVSKAEDSTPQHTIQMKTTLVIRELIGMILIGVAVLVAGLGLLMPEFETEAGIYFALVTATVGVACLWQLNHFSNYIVFSLDVLFTLGLAGTSPQSAAITVIPFITIFIVQCTRWIKTLPDDTQQEDET